MIGIRARLLGSYAMCWVLMVALAVSWSRFDRGPGLGAAALVLSAVVVAAVGWWVSGQVVGRLAKAQTLMAAAVAGDLTGRANDTSADEFGVLGARVTRCSTHCRRY